MARTLHQLLKEYGGVAESLGRLGSGALKSLGQLVRGLHDGESRDRRRPPWP